MNLDVSDKDTSKKVRSVMKTRGASGKHMGKPYTHHIVCESVKVTTPAPLQLDGEIYYDLPFDAHVVKGGVKTFAPIE